MAGACSPPSGTTLAQARKGSHDRESESEMNQSASIGQARMNPDRTIVLDLRASDGNATGDAQLSYKPGDPHYDEVLHHLGGLSPGEVKPVKPWDSRK